MKCLICRETMTANCAPFRQELNRQMAIDDGGTVEVSFGYGSMLDCTTALGFIHDECFKNNVDLFVNVVNGFAGLTKKESQ